MSRSALLPALALLWAVTTAAQGADAAGTAAPAEIPGAAVTLAEAPAAEEAASPVTQAPEEREVRRLIDEERERFGRLAAALALREQALSQLDAERAACQEAVLRWRRLASEARDPARIDSLYPELRRDLKAFRSRFDELLGRSEAGVQVPVLWADPLAGVVSGVVPLQLREERARLQDRLGRLRDREQAALDVMAATLDATLTELNGIRLGLLPRLSPAMRAEVTGFTSAGVDQVRAELWQLSLLARYHAQLISGRLSRGADVTVFDAWRWVVNATPVLLCGLLLLFSRRVTLPALHDREAEIRERELARGLLSATPWRQWLRFVIAVWRPLEWCLFYLAMVWLLPPALDTWLEYRLVLVVSGWLVFGALVVHALNALPVLMSATGAHTHIHAVSTNGLRLRSLQLLGRYVIAVSVLLAVTAELVGKGSFYHWVGELGWLVAVVPFAVLLRWWREPILENAQRFSARSRLMRWIATQRDTVMEPLALVAGGVTVTALLLWMNLRRWADRLDLARRARSLLGRAEEEDEQGLIDAVAVPDTVRGHFSPDNVSPVVVDAPLRAPLAALSGYLQGECTGLVAVTGGRGSGRSTLLSVIEKQVSHAVRVNGRELRDKGHTAWPVAGSGETALLVLVDDADALLEPRPGGLALFDRLHAHARQQADRCTWVFVFNDIAWAFVRRARDQGVLFDLEVPMRPWGEPEIRALLAARNAAAGIEPVPLPVAGHSARIDDPQFRAEEEALRASACVRMIWSHARGNPALALAAWGRSLQQSANGGTVVNTALIDQPLSLNTAADMYLFMVRVILMCEPAHPGVIGAALDLPEAQVVSLLQAGTQRGHLREAAGDYRIDWSWRRALIDLLERKHLLVKP